MLLCKLWNLNKRKHCWYKFTPIDLVLQLCEMAINFLNILHTWNIGWNYILIPETSVEKWTYIYISKYIQINIPRTKEWYIEYSYGGCKSRLYFKISFKKVRWYNCNSSTVTFIPSSISKFMINHLEKSSICKFGLWIHYCLHTIPLQFLVNISKIYLHSFKKEALFTYWTGKQTRYNIQRIYSFFMSHLRQA